MFARWKEKIIFWSKANADTPAASFWLFLLAFTESSFFLIPPDVMLISLILSGSKRWIYYAGLTTLASVLGGLFGYLIGYAFFESIGQYLVELYHLEEGVARVGELFRDNAFIAIFASAFTPIPYKVFTISAGLFHIDIFVFIVGSILGRGLRFYIEGYLMIRFGEGIRALILKYFNIASIVAVLVIIAALVFSRL